MAGEGQLVVWREDANVVGAVLRSESGNVVSERFTSRAIACMRSGGVVSRTTQSALPASGASEKTSTMR